MTSMYDMHLQICWVVTVQKDRGLCTAQRFVTGPDSSCSTQQLPERTPGTLKTCPYACAFQVMHVTCDLACLCLPANAK